MSDPTTPETAMPEPDHNPQDSGKTSPAPAWWSRLHSPSTEPVRNETDDTAAEPEPIATADSGDDSPPQAAVWPPGWTVIPPMGSIVTDVGVTFSLAPVSLTDRPVQVRCTSCEWDTTASQHVATDAVRVHALSHILDPRARIAHLPDWWMPWLKGRR